MGIWNTKAYDNDAAADWLGDLMDATALRTRWLTGIGHDTDKDPCVARAAVWLFIQLGHVYVWPIATYEEDLERTIAVADALRKGPKSTAVSLTALAELEVEYQSLIARRKEPGNMQSSASATVAP